MRGAGDGTRESDAAIGCDSHGCSLLGPPSKADARKPPERACGPSAPTARARPFLGPEPNGG
eukprot:89794-Alexandrium_andersonii.AAC.1